MSKKDITYKTWPKIVMAVASVIGLIGTFLPWYTAKAGSIYESANGYHKIFEPLGAIYLVVFLITIGLSLTAILTKKRAFFKITNIVSVLTSLIAILPILGIVFVHNWGASSIAYYSNIYSTGVGIYAVGAAIVANFIFSVYSPKEK